MGEGETGLGFIFAWMNCKGDTCPLYFFVHVLLQIEVGPKLRVNHRPDRVDYFYAVKFFGNSITPQVPDEILNFGWFTLREAEDLKLFFGFEAELATEVSKSFE